MMNTPPATPKRKRQSKGFATDPTHHNDSPAVGIDSKLRPSPEQNLAAGIHQDQPAGQTEQALAPNDATSLGVADAPDDHATCPSPRAQVANGLGRLVLRGPRSALGQSNAVLDFNGSTIDTSHGFANDEDFNATVDHDDLPAGHRKRLRVHSKETDGENPAMRQITPPPEQPSSSHLASNAQEQRSNADSESTEKPIAIPVDNKIDDLPRRSSPKNKINNLTWHDSEITGHLGLDPDDDRTGMNGIGFRPTSQQIYARSQRRKQQLRDWRERESREERKRRYDRRALVGTVFAKADDEASNIRRTVRFA